ncbi:hypothetical protein ABWL39_18815 [Chitinivorax sp. PXF-14]|uniref:hypothetical protein n=1 Tax=Chitinivorax sp. PXF-14 TaxID=3230488 RepID=UPI0034667E15
MKTASLAITAAAALMFAAAYVSVAGRAHAELPSGSKGTYTPLGVSASGAGSTAWFLDTARDQVVKCSEVAGRAECSRVHIPAS